MCSERGREDERESQQGDEGLIPTLSQMHEITHPRSWCRLLGALLRRQIAEPRNHRCSTPREEPIRNAKVWWRLPVVHSPGCSRGLVEPLWSCVITAVFANQEWCRRGGNGRRGDLAGLWAQARVSSNLTAGTAAPLSRTRDGCKLPIPVRSQWRFRYAKPESHALRLLFTQPPYPPRTCESRLV